MLSLRFFTAACAFPKSHAAHTWRLLSTNSGSLNKSLMIFTELLAWCLDPASIRLPAGIEFVFQVPPTITARSQSSKVATVSGLAAPLHMANVDTAMIIPEQLLHILTKTGLSKSGSTTSLGKLLPFVLDEAPYTNATILVNDVQDPWKSPLLEAP
ncbi:hypothetical protein C8J56DRAFT_1042740 [Mycena floridula]|nr:hypothetical protein C8J56DRAFT_1042740 [Mycena floridula]